MVVSSHLDLDIKIGRNNVCRYLGYRDDVEPSARIASLLDEYMETARNIIEPSCSYVIKDVKVIAGSRVFVGGPVIFESEAIAKLLEKCDKVAIFVLTIGKRFDEMTRWLADSGLIVEAYVLDAVGSSMTEGLADSVQARIRDIAYAHGLRISRRFCPGYCDWDISQQGMVFRAMNGEHPGVFLTEDYLMVPEKSMSGIIGMGSYNSGVDSYSPCTTCDKRSCPGRR
jgi:hypothetical protein